MVFMIIIPIKWLFHWEYILFSDKPRSGDVQYSQVMGQWHQPLFSEGTSNKLFGTDLLQHLLSEGEKKKASWDRPKTEENLWWISRTGRRWMVV